MKTDFQSASHLLDYFSNKYRLRHNKKPEINRNREKWSAVSILEEITIGEAKELIDYYFDTQRKHSFQWFAYNYDKLARAKRQRDKDRAERERLREETKQRIEQYRSV